YLAAAALAACASKHDTPAPAPPETRPRCEPLPFAASIPLAEASGAALLPAGLLVVADSGNHGAYVIVDPDTGDVREQGRLPLPDGVSDDLEGISSPDATIVYGLVSDGTLLRWRRDGAAFALVDS